MEARKAKGNTEKYLGEIRRSRYSWATEEEMEKGGWKVNLFTCSTAANKEPGESEEEEERSVMSCLLFCSGRRRFCPKPVSVSASPNLRKSFRLNLIQMQ